MNQQQSVTAEQLVLPNAVVGILLDRGSEKLNQLQAQTGCRIQLQEDLHPAQTGCRIQLQEDPSRPEAQRICTIIGSPQGIAMAKSALQGPSHPPSHPQVYQQQQQQQQQQMQQSMEAINQYRQQVMQYRALGMTREAEMLDRQVALWSQQLQQQMIQQQLMMQAPNHQQLQQQQQQQLQQQQQQQLQQQKASQHAAATASQQQQHLAQYYRSLAEAGEDKQENRGYASE